MAQNQSIQVYGILAEFNTVAEIKNAATAVCKAGYQNWDVFTPFPIHGMDTAMGLKPSKVGWFAFAGGTAGFALGMLMIWYMNQYNYPLLIGGKPLFSPVYAIPVSFELSILFAAFGAIFAMLTFNCLPKWYHPLLKNKRFKRANHDRFFIAIESTDPLFSELETRKLLESVGSTHIELVED